MGDSVQIVSLCVSTIHNKNELKYLIIMLDSWYNQSKRCKMLLSIGFITDELMNEFFEHKYDNQLEVVIEIYNKPEFIRYKELVNRLISSKKSVVDTNHLHNRVGTSVIKTDINPTYWIIFTKDSHIWHTDRVRHYHTVVSNTKHTDKKVCYVQYNISARHKNQDKFYEEDNLPSSDMEVVKTNHHEYVVDNCMYLIPLHILSRFFERATDRVLSQKCMFMYFIKYLKTYCDKTDYHPVIIVPDNEEDNWMYFYRYKDHIKFVESPSVLYDEEVKSIIQTSTQQDDVKLVLYDVEFLLGTMSKDGIISNDWKMSLEKMKLISGCNYQTIVNSIRPTYPIVDKILDTPYYKTLRKELCKLYH